MKITTFSKIALLACAFGTIGLTKTLAQDAGGGGGGGGGMMKTLTPDERAELKKDSEQVEAANPDLKKEADDLKAKHEALGGDASPEDKKAFHMAMMQHMKNEKDAIIKIDPAAQAIYDKIAAARKARMAAAAAGGDAGQ